ncbi:MAG: class I SAM-dependent methyltransferase family protein [Nanoarchaeota archaeon]
MRIGYPSNRNLKSPQFSNMNKIGYDVVGNIVIIKFDRSKSANFKKKFAVDYLKKNKSVTTVLEKVGKFSGRLRTLKTRFIAGEKTLEALYRENGCEFRFNVETCYFSPRLSEERKNVSKMIKKGERVLVMFAGVGPFSIVIGKSSKASEVYSVELGKDASKYALENVKRNKLIGKVHVVQGDVRRVIGKGKKVSGNFDRILMTRPNLEDSFLDVAFRVTKKGTIIHYYGFYLEDEVDKLNELIINEAFRAGKKVKILRIVKAGDIGARKFRYRADIIVN